VNPLDIFPNAHHITGGTMPIQTTAPTPLVLTVEEAANRLGIGRTLMYALVKSGDIESVTIGRLRRIPADALVTFVDSLRTANPKVAA
jgi:excisionase family DNA binding protein